MPKILIVDEEPIASFIRECLERIGYKIAVALTGKDALMMYQK